MVELTHTSCVLVGDIHGETQSLLDDFEREDIIITDTDLVLLGDIGLGFHYYSYHFYFYNVEYNMINKL